MNQRFQIAIALLALGLFSYGFQSQVHQHLDKASPGNQKPAVTTAGEDTLDNIPIVDHHTHIFSPNVRSYLVKNVEGLSSLPPLGLTQLMQTLRKDSVKKAAVLSNAYFFSEAGSTSAKKFKTLRTENDRIAKAVARHPDTLAGFFSVNPLSDSAFAVIEHNAAREEFAGLKLHLANSGIDLRNPEHTQRLGAIFNKANRLDLGIVIHMRTRDRPYGRKDARIFIDSVLSKAPDIPIQIAHMAGWGGYDESTDAALAVFADRISNGQLGVCRT